jgi:anti-anti-sigma factor
MEIVVSSHEGRVPVTILQVTGEVVVDSYEQLQQQARDAYQAGARTILLDLSGVTFLSSSGLRAIHYIFDMLRGVASEESALAMRQGVRDGTFRSANLKLLNPNRDVLGTLKMAGFDMFLEIYTDRKEALDSF